jgi:hypothetical protein
MADDTIIWSEGVGTVVFVPKIRDKDAPAVEISRVLHVPRLKNNLLAVLYLVYKKGFRLEAEKDLMNFFLEGKLLVQARISDNNAGHLIGSTAIQHVNFLSTLPVDLSLWHRRFSHLNEDALKHVISKTRHWYHPSIDFSIRSHL